MGIQVEVRPPYELDGFNGKFETDGKVSLRRSVYTRGCEKERFLVRRSYEQMCAILDALNEINCIGSVTCSIKSGEFQITGSVRLWFNDAQPAVVNALRHLSDLGWQAARASKESYADIHAMITKTVTRKHAA